MITKNSDQPIKLTPVWHTSYNFP